MISRLVIVCITVLGLCLAGCGEEDCGNCGAEASVNITGSWQWMTTTASGGGGGTMALTQSGTSVSGTIINPSASNVDVAISGTVNGNSLIFTFTDPGDGSLVTVTTTVSGNSMAGNAVADSGTAANWTATRV